MVYFPDLFHAFPLLPAWMVFSYKNTGQATANNLSDLCSGLRMLPGLSESPDTSGLDAYCRASDGRRTHSIADLNNCIGVNSTGGFVTGPGSVDFRHVCGYCGIEDNRFLQCQCMDEDGAWRDSTIDLETFLYVDEKGHLLGCGPRPIDPNAPHSGYTGTCDAFEFYDTTGVLAKGVQYHLESEDWRWKACIAMKQQESGHSSKPHWVG
ncbi:hypothetical protein C8R43DRAFT_957014 [Mycena crocata]|nr:hypothetical protein C8R43DRAFT_957014 [Mycena crocata]